MKGGFQGSLCRSNLASSKLVVWEGLGRTRRNDSELHLSWLGSRSARSREISKRVRSLPRPADSQLLLAMSNWANQKTSFLDYLRLKKNLSIGHYAHDFILTLEMTV